MSRARWPRTIAHADMDAFYAAIEQLDDPALRGRPVLVGAASGRGVVLTASYEARPARVGSAMPMAIAKRRCPDAIIVPPRFERYREVSQRIMRVFRDFSPAVEPISLDEAFLDMTGSGHIFGEPETLGRRLKQAIADATGGLTASIGISATKYVAKVASAHRKPDGLTIVPPDEATAWLAPQPVSVLWGAGPKTVERLHAAGLETVGDIAALDEDQLAQRLGKAGRHFWALANGRDPRPVEGSRSAKSLSSERTLQRDVSDPATIEFHLRKASDQVAQRLRRNGLVARGVRVKLKRADFRILTRQRRLRAPTNATETICSAARSLLPEFNDTGPFRLIGVAAYELDAAPESAQLDLLGGAVRRDRRLDRVRDDIERRFGHGSLRRARDLEGGTLLDNAPNLDFLEPDEQE